MHRAAGAFLALAVAAGLVAAVGEVTVPVPSLAQDDPAAIPLGLIVPLAASAVLVRGAYAGPADLEAVAVRPARAHRTCMIILACAAALLAGLAAAEAVPYGMAAARNLVGFTGLATVAAMWRRDLATAVPAAYMIAAMLLGAGTGPGSWWDWPAVTSARPLTWAVPVAALAFGLTGREGRLPVPWGPRRPGPRVRAQP
ncbi:hypothetical protein Psi01_35120 [Planobispora siamensis]|uniref:Integral membrane protein n=1 Tax=Planobispora siamensis TaxID=936338 RepID=A0A8J3WLV1_9ACTN|nr:hypothetical protein Psi01_35120 [Planobispora siamensis]